ncbi:MAG TPA: TadE family protein [Duganella sp.]|nr:TadE family protein [Duganella sp.]
MRPSIGGGVGRQRGIAAVELALMMPILVLMLVMPLYLGRVFWHYTVIEHAAQDAARYLSKIPVAELSNPARAPTVVAAANAIVAEELAELSPGGYGYGLLISCDGSVCLGFSKPATVRVNISLLIQDIFFPGLNSLSIPLYADVSYPYLGR